MLGWTDESTTKEKCTKYKMERKQKQPAIKLYYHVFLAQLCIMSNGGFCYKELWHRKANDR